MSGFNKERLCNLIRLLATPVDGERLGAVCGIDRILKAAGLSFHDLAKAVERSELVVDSAGKVANGWIGAGQQMLQAGGLNEKEQEFVQDMVRRFSSNPAFIATERQMNWFVFLYQRQQLAA